MANWNRLTEKQYNAIKTLLKGGATQAEAAEYMQVSPNTAYHVNKSENFEEYLQIQAERQLSKKRQVAAMKAKQDAAKKVSEQVGAVPAAMLAQQPQPAAQVVEHRQTVTVQATWQMMQEMQKTNELLKLISNKLAFIVDELCGVPTKKE